MNATQPKETENAVDIDGRDRRIIDALIDDGRQSLRDIAKKVGVSVATVMQRVRRLEESKVIRRYTADVDYEKLGFDVQVIISLIVSKGKLLEVEKRIANSPNVSAVYDVTGDHDVLIIAKFPTRRSMDAFLKKIQTYDFVERTETKLILNIIKESQIKV